MLKQEIFSINSHVDFTRLALQVFQYQYQNNSVYRTFCNYLNIDTRAVSKLTDIPFLPIQFFKSKDVRSNNTPIQTVFTSSGTTGQQTSKHVVTDLDLYKQSFMTSFKAVYGNPEDYCILALLPSYLEREGSSLIYMVNHLIETSAHEESGFYLNDLDGLAHTLKTLDQAGKKVMLIGVSFALLDLVERYQFNLKHTIVMETGGMKGRRKELIREELHAILKRGFGLPHIHSEYGMTELLSQAYSTGQGVFNCPSHMALLIRDSEDAISYLSQGKTGGINVIDLANIDSCSFIATQDLGRQVGVNAFEILGRFDHSDVRGCNLMAL